MPGQAAGWAYCYTATAKKRQGLVILVSALPGPIAAKDEDEKEKKEVAPLHLMVLVDSQNGKKSNSILPYLALIDTSATYNFVPYVIPNNIGMRPAEAERQKTAIAKLPTIAAVNSVSLHAMAIVLYMVCMRNGVGIKQCYLINFTITDIVGYNVI